MSSPKSIRVVICFMKTRFRRLGGWVNIQTLINELSLASARSCEISCDQLYSDALEWRLKDYKPSECYICSRTKCPVTILLISLQLTLTAVWLIYLKLFGAVRTDCMSSVLFEAFGGEVFAGCSRNFKKKEWDEKKRKNTTNNDNKRTKNNQW